MYNGIEVLREAREGDPKTSDVYGVEWQCSEEFDASPTAAISFVQPGAYVAFQDSYPRTGGSISMQIKTQSQHALLLYNTGPPSRLGSNPGAKNSAGVLAKWVRAFLRGISQGKK